MESERSTPSQINELKALTMPRVWPISGGALFRHQIVVTLASLYPLSSWSGGRRSVDTLVSEQCPGDAGCLIGHGDQHDVCRPPRQEPVGPAMARRQRSTLANDALKLFFPHVDTSIAGRFLETLGLTLFSLCFRHCSQSQVRSVLALWAVHKWLIFAYLRGPDAHQGHCQTKSIVDAPSVWSSNQTPFWRTRRRKGGVHTIRLNRLERGRKVS